jgi:hypothetical protein
VRGEAPHRYFLVLYAYFFSGKGVTVLNKIGYFTAISFQTRHKLKYKTRCGASPCDPSCGGFDRVLL